VTLRPAGADAPAPIDPGNPVPVAALARFRTGGGDAPAGIRQAFFADGANLSAADGRDSRRCNEDTD
jgi:hypothetical protein